LAEIARAFHRGLAEGIQQRIVAEEYGTGTVVLSGGVFQNELLLEDLRTLLGPFTVWTNRDVPPNDGGISLGQAVLAR
jgi:hydrogenase maturation protein HypF